MPMSFSPQQLADVLRKYNIDPAQFSGKGQGSFSDFDISKLFSGGDGSGIGAGGAGAAGLSDGMPAPSLSGEGDLELPPTPPTPSAQSLPPMSDSVGPSFEGMSEMPSSDPYRYRDQQIERMQRGELGGRAPMSEETDDRYKFAPIPGLGDVEGGSFEQDEASREMQKALERMNRIGGGNNPATMPLDDLDRTLATRRRRR